MDKLTVSTHIKRFDVAPDLYGIFFEDINRSGDSGLYPEMIRNRTFEDSIPPERCVLAEDGTTFLTPEGWKDTFNHGEGLTRWINENQTPFTPIPAWYTQEADMELDGTDRLNSRRLVSLKARFHRSGALFNTGYNGLALEKGQTYAFYMFAKVEGTPSTVTIRLESKDGKPYDSRSFRVGTHGFARYDAVFLASADDFHARLTLSAPEGSVLNIGFISLMPTDTYNGHGLRKDLVEKLAGLHAKFLRFPGGCIVEGFTYETAMRFSNTIGPVWERPSHQLMWHYRTTNGLGYHEYLQLCEDLDLEPMYVFNCGLTCQGRAPELFDEQGTADLLQEAMDAIDYATAPADSKWGKVRAAAGHPSPFKMNYVEIGNENHGPEYNSRYAKCYSALKARYPSLALISNTHTERDGLPTDIADEHFYNSPEFFAEQIRKYDTYDRKGPRIFVGEYAITQGHTGTLHCALHEAMFLIGLENNQDIVTLSAYAPLMQNIHFASWSPNLILFDNHRSFGIPTYHMLGLLGANRGRDVVESSLETSSRFRPASGFFGIGGGKPGLRYRQPMLDGKPADLSRHILGSVEWRDGVYTTMDAPAPAWMQHLPETARLAGSTLTTWGDSETETGVFEADVQVDPEIPVSLVAWVGCPESNIYTRDRLNAPPEDTDWSIFTVRKYEWTVFNGTSSVFEGRLFRPVALAEPRQVTLDSNRFHNFRITTRKGGFDCYIDGELVQSAELPSYPEMGCVVTTEGDTILIKLVNVAPEERDVGIRLDCDVASAYRVELLAGEAMAENSLDQPDKVFSRELSSNGAARTFTYRAPASSISILKLKKA